MNFELRVEENCSLKDGIQPHLNNVEVLLTSLFKLYPIDSLKKIIITDNNFKNHEKSTQANSMVIDKNINLKMILIKVAL